MGGERRRKRRCGWMGGGRRAVVAGRPVELEGDWEAWHTYQQRREFYPAKKEAVIPTKRPGKTEQKISTEAEDWRNKSETYQAKAQHFTFSIFLC